MATKLWAALLVLLIVSPFTAPFQTCDLAAHGPALPTHALMSTATDSDDGTPVVSPETTRSLKLILLTDDVPSVRTALLMLPADSRLNTPTNHDAEIRSVLRV